MDCRAVLLFCLAIFLAVLVTEVQGRTKKVVIHVPYKVKKIKHIHTVYKTVHHHHSHRDHGPSDDHEHFHYMHHHDDTGAHSKPIPGIGIPEFLPDVPLDVPDLPDIPRDLPPVHRLPVPLFRRNLIPDIY